MPRTTSSRGSPVRPASRRGSSSTTSPSSSPTAERPRVNHFREDTDPIDGSLIVVPLRGRGGAIGVLTIERLGAGNIFSAEEFELVQLFAAQVSIALQNAEVFQAVEIRAQTDDLTGLLNYGTFQEWLERSVREGTPFSLIMLDLDDFRTVNNDPRPPGRRRGAATYRGEPDPGRRDSDLIFRYGGDEFTFLLPNTDESGALQVAERARVAVAATDGPVTASVGVATFPTDGATATDVLLAADRACYVAKRGGRDRIVTAAEGLALAPSSPSSHRPRSTRRRRRLPDGSSPLFAQGVTMDEMRHSRRLTGVLLIAVPPRRLRAGADDRVRPATQRRRRRRRTGTDTCRPTRRRRSSARRRRRSRPSSRTRSSRATAWRDRAAVQTSARRSPTGTGRLIRRSTRIRLVPAGLPEGRLGPPGDPECRVDPESLPPCRRAADPADSGGRPLWCADAHTSPGAADRRDGRGRRPPGDRQRGRQERPLRVERDPAWRRGDHPGRDVRRGRRGTPRSPRWTAC